MFHHFIVIVHKGCLLILVRRCRSARAARSGHFNLFHNIFLVDARQLQRDSAHTLDYISLTRGVITQFFKFDTVDREVLPLFCNESNLYHIEHLFSSIK